MMKFWIYENHVCELQSEELYKIAYNYNCDDLPSHN